jgi:RHS repeat-associated protein
LRADFKGKHLQVSNFADKERDEETGLYYYRARYLDPKTSRWLSTDPALGDYIPGAPINDEVKKRNSNLPGMGGVFNTVNLHLYHYAGNNPVRYLDPTGKDIILLMDPDRGRSRNFFNIPFGHAAALVGNDENGWLYYSNDGPLSTDVQWFKSTEDFFKNYASDRTNPFKFNENGRVETTAEQDKAMQTKAFDLANIDSSVGFAEENVSSGTRFNVDKSKISHYSFLSNNCSQHVDEIANAGEVYSTNSLVPKLQILLTKEEYMNYLKTESYKSFQH